MLKDKIHIKIKLSEHYKNSIASRAAIINLFDLDFSQIESLEVDFSDITFVSRSATHQFIKEKERIANNFQVKVVFSNVTTELKEIFEIVNESIENPKTLTSSIHRVYFSTQKEFQNFLSRV